LSVFIYLSKFFVTYPAVRTSNINRKSPNSKSGRNKRNKARPGKMYNNRLNIKNLRECVTSLRRNALDK
jgi:hypothetical protein